MIDLVLKARELLAWQLRAKPRSPGISTMTQIASLEKMVHALSDELEVRCAAFVELDNKYHRQRAANCTPEVAEENRRLREELGFRALDLRTRDEIIAKQDRRLNKYRAHHSRIDYLSRSIERLNNVIARYRRKTRRMHEALKTTKQELNRALDMVQGLGIENTELKCNKHALNDFEKIHDLLAPLFPDSMGKWPLELAEIAREEILRLRGVQ